MSWREIKHDDVYTDDEVNAVFQKVQDIVVGNSGYSIRK